MVRTKEALLVNSYTKTVSNKAKEVLSTKLDKVSCTEVGNNKVKEDLSTSLSRDSSIRKLVDSKRSYLHS